MCKACQIFKDTQLASPSTRAQQLDTFCSLISSMEAISYSLNAIDKIFSTRKASPGYNLDGWEQCPLSRGLFCGGRGRHVSGDLQPDIDAFAWGQRVPDPTEAAESQS